MKKHVLFMFAIVIAFVMISFKSDSKILRPAFGGITLNIKALHDANSVWSSRKYFHNVDCRFQYLSVDSAPTKETPVRIYKLRTDTGEVTGSIAGSFMSLSRDTESLCLTQGQIIEFVRTYPQFLRKGIGSTEANFFVFRANNHFKIMEVYYFLNGHIDVWQGDFSDAYNNLALYSSSRCLFIVPAAK